jgi:ABC-type nitrate/sulfonate/bicarbonate transport system substrate-binding protein
MTKLLKEALAKVEVLTDEEQDEAAELLLNLVARRDGPVHLDDETRAAVREGLAQADRGEFASDEEMAKFFAQHRE